MAKSIVPKGCVIHAVELTKKGAHVRFRCLRGAFLETGNETYRKYNRKGEVVSISNYPSKDLRGVRSVRLPGGISITGSGSVAGFMKCQRDRNELSCHPST